MGGHATSARSWKAQGITSVRVNSVTNKQTNKLKTYLGSSTDRIPSIDNTVVIIFAVLHDHSY